MDAFFPGSSGVNRKFEIELREMEPRVPFPSGSVLVTPFIGMHPSGDNAYSLRFEVGGKVIACSGDTEWTDALAEAARGADLLIAEAYFHDKKVPFHLDYRTLMEKSAGLGVRRTVITHMSDDMLLMNSREGHCERSEAISMNSRDCFVAGAPRNDGSTLFLPSITPSPRRGPGLAMTGHVTCDAADDGKVFEV